MFPVSEPLIDTARMVPPGGKRRAYRLIQALVEGALGVRAFNRYYQRLPKDGLSPAQFCEAGLAELGVAWRPDEAEWAALRAVQGPCVVVANHPLGENLTEEFLTDTVATLQKLLSRRKRQQVPETEDRLSQLNAMFRQTKTDPRQKTESPDDIF